MGGKSYSFAGLMMHWVKFAESLGTAIFEFDDSGHGWLTTVSKALNNQ
jgi:hypothetical protein